MTRHEQLWAPWRLAYVSGKEGSVDPTAGRRLEFLPGADAGCFICRGLADSVDRDHLIVERTALSVVILNRFPYNNGHLLLSPQTHKGRLDELSAHEHADLQQLLLKYTSRIERLIQAEGFNVGLNLGRVAGAGVPGHLHWHVVPRWSGDTNFMPTVAGTQVIAQSLESLWEMLRADDAPGKPD